jgi:hypothetical protein
MSKKYDIIEYSYAKQIVKDYPELMKILGQFKYQLRPYKKYVTAKLISDTIDDVVYSIENNYEYYSEVYKSKGETDV